MQYTYLLVNLFIVFFPFVFSFESRIEFYKQWKRLFFSALPVSLFFILWDMIATSRGHWSFNPEFTTGLKVINLPIEEILFFITVPYSAIFLFELVSYMYSQHLHKLPAFADLIANAEQLLQRCWKYVSKYALPLLFFISVLYIALELRLMSNGKEYTWFLGLVSALVLILFTLSKVAQLTEFWIWVSVMTTLFFITNAFLTGLPVVNYGYQFITNVRVGTIPIEDFIYNWSLLGLYFYTYTRQSIRQLSNVLIP